MKKALFLFTMILAGSTVFAQPKSDMKSDEDAIRNLSKKWLEMTKKHDAAGAAAIFADDGVSYGVYRTPIKGPEAIEKHYREDDMKNPKAEINWSTERVDVASSGDMAVEYGKYDVKKLGQDASGSDEGKYVTVYRKVNGTWKVVADIGTSTVPQKK
jgi:uncharacterized protein (TIGR02246 family)